MDWPNLTPRPNPRYLLFFVDFEIQGQFMVVIRSVLVDLKSNHGPELDFGFSMMEFFSFDTKFWTSAKNGAFWVPILVRPGVALSGLEWPWAAWSGLEWPWAALSGLEWPWVALSGLEWPGVAWSGLEWPWIALLCVRFRARFRAGFTSDLLVISPN